jgi:hypothetical protein
VLLFTVIIGSSYIPQFGLNEAFLTSANYVGLNIEGGDFFETPHIFMCFGVLYYLILMFVTINAEIQKNKLSLLPSTDSEQVPEEQPKIENGQSKPTIIHQFENENNKTPPGCGCSPWVVFILAAVLIAIGAWKDINLFIWLGIVILFAGAGLALISKLMKKQKSNNK